jgi:hypothetical protein
MTVCRLMAGSPETAGELAMGLVIVHLPVRGFRWSRGQRHIPGRLRKQSEAWLQRGGRDPSVQPPLQVLVKAWGHPRAAVVLETRRHSLIRLICAVTVPCGHIN